MVATTQVENSEVLFPASVAVAVTVGSVMHTLERIAVKMTSPLSSV